MDIRHQLLSFGIDGVTIVRRRFGGGDQPLVVPAPLVAAFGGGCDPVKLDVFLPVCDALGCFADDFVAQGDQMLPSEAGIFLCQLSGVV